MRFLFSLLTFVILTAGFSSEAFCHYYSGYDNEFFANAGPTYSTKKSIGGEVTVGWAGIESAAVIAFPVFPPLWVSAGGAYLNEPNRPKQGMWYWEAGCNVLMNIGFGVAYPYSGHTSLNGLYAFFGIPVPVPMTYNPMPVLELFMKKYHHAAEFGLMAKIFFYTGN